jgi:transposase
MPVHITRNEHSVDEILSEARRCEDAKQARRLLGVAMLLEGAALGTVAKAAGVSRQTLRNWIVHFNQRGVARPKVGPKSPASRELDETRLREFDIRVERLKARVCEDRRLQRRYRVGIAPAVGAPAPGVGTLENIAATSTRELPDARGRPTARDLNPG